MRRTDDIERIVTAAHALTRIAALRMQSDVPATQWRALSVLRAEGPLRVGDLARRARTTQPGMTRLVHSLVDEGFVTREADPADSRATIVEITPSGREAIATWLAQLGSALEPMFTDLDDEDWAALSHAARILTARAETLSGLSA